MKNTQKTKRVSFNVPSEPRVSRKAAKYHKTGKKHNTGSMLSVPRLETITEEPEHQPPDMKLVLNVEISLIRKEMQT
ncbi:unnamed protein product [Cylicocyclus nassatus]|uniref:Uncharacterized protein n=1 Tax=Cylicocyclus nassatus TaxID=53992 RepID=A0AA36M8R0_CYLNA|nr:unnamed protein product [Cylicocyclus nassatus]